MTEQEAIDYYNNVVIDTKIGFENMCKTSDLINLSIKALEKQIPKKNQCCKFNTSLLSFLRLVF